MCKTVLAAVLVLAAAAIAVEYPVVPGAISANPNIARPSDRDQSGPEVPWAPVWTALERMTLSERQNSEISLELPSDASPEARAAARDVENLWNTGRYDEALAGFAEVGRHVDVRQIAVGNRWRVPVPTTETDLWGDDVRIGNRDSISALAFDIHRASGNLFAALLLKGDGATYKWTVNFSTDGGLTWSETFSWNAFYGMKSFSAAVLGNYFHVAFGRGAAQDQAFLYRFRTSDGVQENFNNGSAYVTVFTVSSDSIKEVALSSNQDYQDNRLYYTAMLTQGAVKYCWADTGAVSWDTSYATGVTNGANGLDACTNEGYDSTFIWISFYDQAGNLRIIGRRGTGFTNFVTRPAGGGDYTSIGAYHDTIVCTFDYQAHSPTVVRYETNYGGGHPDSLWRYGYPAWDTTTISESPDVALRKGGGEGFVYRYYTPTRELRYIWRNYYGNWSTPVAIADHEPYYNRPAIEYLGSGAYGVVYVRWSNFTAYFDRTDWTGIAEQRRLVQDENILNVTPNPLSGHGRLNYTLNRAADLRVRVYDRTGRVVRTLFDGRSPAGKQSLGFDAAGMVPGVYFVRADADGSVLTVPVTVVK